VDERALNWSIPIGVWQQLEDANVVFGQRGVIEFRQRSAGARGWDALSGVLDGAHLCPAIVTVGRQKQGFLL